MASKQVPEEDPLSPPPFPIASRVTIRGLKSKPEWNGRSGNVLCFYRTGRHAGRCGVQLDGGDLPTAAFKPLNLAPENDFRPWPATSSPEVNQFFDDVYELKNQGKLGCFRNELTNAVASAAFRGKDAQCQFLFAKEALVSEELDQNTMTTAALLLELAAEQGHVLAMHMLGTLKETGYGDASKSDFKAAKKLYERAMKFDYASSFGRFGILYEGKSISSDDTIGPQAHANEFYERAALLGDPVGAFYLGCSYRDGDGLPPNRQLALYWFRYAAGENMDHDDARQCFTALQRDTNYAPGSANKLSLEQEKREAEEMERSRALRPDDGMLRTIDSLKLA